MRRRFVLVAPALLALFAACSDVNSPDRTRATVLSPANPTNLDQSEERGVFERYVAIGTSISMGWQSDGVIAATQETSWPAQLAGMTEHSMTQPYIDGTGCRSPLV